MAAAGLPFFYTQAQAQNRAAGNPVDTLPAPPPAANDRPTDASIGTIAPPQAPAPQSPGAVTFTPASFEIEGVQGIPFEEVAALFQNLSGRPTTVSVLTETARQCTALYQKHGYALSFCFVPEQDFRNGIVRIAAVEGHIATVTLEGDAGPAEARIRAMAEEIRADKPLTLAVFERYTQLMGRLPGVGVEANATPPTTTDGAGALRLQVTRRPYQLSLGTELRGSRPRAVVTGVVNDPLIAGGSVSASTLIGGFPGERFGAVAYSQAIGTEGLTLRAETSLYKGDPDAHLQTAPAIKRFNHYRRTELSAAYPIVLTRTSSLSISGGVYAVKNTDDYSNPANGAMLTEEVDVRAAYAQASYSEASPQRSRSAIVRYVQGIDGLGAGKSISANFPGPLPQNPARLDFSRIVVEGSQRDRWGKDWGTAVSFSAQYTRDVLPSTERVSFGGTRFGRAFLSGDAAGDYGWGVGLELNRSFAVDTTWVKSIQPYVLAERARVYSNLGTLPFAKLTSATLGVRVSDSKHYTVDLAASKPSGDPSPTNTNRAVRYSALLSYSLGR